MSLDGADSSVHMESGVTEQRRYAGCSREHVVQPRSRGFSLLEMVLVLAILAIVAAVAAPRWGGWTGNLERAAETLAADLRYAQNLSLHLGVGHEVRFQGNGYSLQTVSGQPKVFADGRGSRSLQGISTTGPSEGRVRFAYPVGNSEEQETIELREGDRSMVVEVAAETGYISVEAN